MASQPLSTTTPYNDAFYSDTHEVFDVVSVGFDLARHATLSVLEKIKEKMEGAAASTQKEKGFATLPRGLQGSGKLYLSYLNGGGATPQLTGGNTMPDDMSGLFSGDFLAKMMEEIRKSAEEYHELGMKVGALIKTTFDPLFPDSMYAPLLQDDGGGNCNDAAIRVLGKTLYGYYNSFYHTIRRCVYDPKELALRKAKFAQQKAELLAAEASKCQKDLAEQAQKLGNKFDPSRGIGGLLDAAVSSSYGFDRLELELVKGRCTPDYMLMIANAKLFPEIFFEFPLKVKTCKTEAYKLFGDRLNFVMAFEKGLLTCRRSKHQGGRGAGGGNDDTAAEFSDASIAAWQRISADYTAAQGDPTTAGFFDLFSVWDPNTGNALNASALVDVYETLAGIKTPNFF